MVIKGLQLCRLKSYYDDGGKTIVWPCSNAKRVGFQSPTEREVVNFKKQCHRSLKKIFAQRGFKTNCVITRRESGGKRYYELWGRLSPNRSLSSIYQSPQYYARSQVKSRGDGFGSLSLSCSLLLSKIEKIDGVSYKTTEQIVYYYGNRLKVATLAENMNFNGLDCKAGEQVWFHRNGNLEFVLLTTERYYKDIPCNYIEFHKNGELKRFTLSRDHIFKNVAYRERTTIILDDSGNLLSARLNIPYRKDKWTKFHPNGVLHEGTLLQDIEINGIMMKAGEGVGLDEGGRFVDWYSTLRNKVIQGIPCNGRKGIWFHSNGKLKEAILSRSHKFSNGVELEAATKIRFKEDGFIDLSDRRQVKINGLKFKVLGLEFHKNGRLRYGVIDRDGAILKSNTQCWFYDDGTLMQVKLPAQNTIQGHVFSSGVSVNFDKEGKLEWALASQDYVVDGIPCKRETSVVFRVREGIKSKTLTLSKKFKINGTEFNAGSVLNFDMVRVRYPICKSGRGFGLCTPKPDGRPNVDSSGTPLDPKSQNLDGRRIRRSLRARGELGKLPVNTCRQTKLPNCELISWQKDVNSSIYYFIEGDSQSAQSIQPAQPAPTKAAPSPSGKSAPQVATLINKLNRQVGELNYMLRSFKEAKDEKARERIETEFSSKFQALVSVFRELAPLSTSEEQAKTVAQLRVELQTLQKSFIAEMTRVKEAKEKEAFKEYGSLKAQLEKSVQFLQKINKDSLKIKDVINEEFEKSLLLLGKLAALVKQMSKDRQNDATVEMDTLMKTRLGAYHKWYRVGVALPESRPAPPSSQMASTRKSPVRTTTDRTKIIKTFGSIGIPLAFGSSLIAYGTVASGTIGTVGLATGIGLIVAALGIGGYALYRVMTKKKR